MAVRRSELSRARGIATRGSRARTTRPAAMAVAVAGALASLATTGCDSAKKHEAAAVVNAVDRYRSAENPAKPAAAKELAAVPCTDPEICAVKKACIDVAEPTAKALELKEEVEKGLTRVQAGQLAKDAPEAQALPGKLDDAERLLEQGRAALQGCDEKVLRLRGSYGI